MCGGITSLCPTPGFLWPWVQVGSPREQLSHSSAGCDQGGLGEGDWCLLGGWGKGLQCLCKWFWLLEQECCLLDFDCSVDGFSLGCLAASATWWLAEGDWAHPQQCPLLCEVGVADLGLLWRPALAIFWASSRCSSFMHSSCCHCRSTLGTVMYSPSRPSQQTSRSLHLWTLKVSWWRGAQGPSLQLSWLAELGIA